MTIVIATPQEFNGADVTSAAVPITAASGSLLIVFVSCYNGGNETLPTPAGWTRLAFSTALASRPVIFAKVSDGGEGSTLTLQRSNPANAFDIAAKSYSLSNWDGSISNVELSSWVSQNVDAGIDFVDPSLITASWGASPNNLFLSSAFGTRANSPFVTTPTGYTSITGSSGVDGSGFSCHVATGYKVANSATDDPSNFVAAVNQRMETIGIVVKGVAATSLTADSITAAPIYDGTTVTINLSNATNAAGKTLSIPQGALTATAQDINSISFLAPDLRTFGDLTGDYSTNITITVDDAGDSATIDFQVLPDSGYEVVTVAALEGLYGEAAVIAAPLSIGDYVYVPIISGADFTVGAVPVLATEQIIPVQYKDLTDNQWKEGFIFTIPGSGGGLTSKVINITIGISL